MRVLLSLALLLVFAAHSAYAKLPPLARQPDAARPDASTIDLGPASTMLEADYFSIRRPQMGAARIFPCRLRLHATRDRLRLAQSCD